MTSHVRAPRRRLLVVAVTAAALLLSAALSFILIPSSGAPHKPSGDAAPGISMTPDQGDPVESPVGITVRSTDNASVQLRVLREPSEPGVDPNAETSQVVFEETVPLTNVASGFAMWSGKLSISDWSGGCHSDTIYEIAATVLDADGAPAGTLGSTRWFSCSAS